MIARCIDVADVVAAINVGRDHDLLVAIRGGGHNGPGLGSCDDGILIDMSLMKSVRVDRRARTVRVDAGCTSGDVDHATHAVGLAVPFGIVSTTRVAGLTLGGGTGYCHLCFGDYSGSDYSGQLLLDTLVHGWDIAKATGKDTRLDSESVNTCLPIAEQLTNQFRSAGVFGENLSVSPDADAQTRLLAMMGRRE